MTVTFWKIYFHSKVKKPLKIFLKGHKNDLFDSQFSPKNKSDWMWLCDVSISMQEKNSFKHNYNKIKFILKNEWKTNFFSPFYFYVKTEEKQSKKCFKLPSSVDRFGNFTSDQGCSKGWSNSTSPELIYFNQNEVIPIVWNLLIFSCLNALILHF